MASVGAAWPAGRLARAIQVGVGGVDGGVPELVAHFVERHAVLEEARAGRAPQVVEGRVRKHMPTEAPERLQPSSAGTAGGRPRIVAA